MKVCQTVNLLDDKFRLVTLLPGDVVPDWARERITNPEAIAPDDDSGAAVAEAVSAATTPEPETVTPATEQEDSYSELDKKGLQELLEERGLPTSGNKPELVERLREADAASDDEHEEVDLWSLNVEELKAYAAERGIDVGEASTSDELAAVIESVPSE